MWDRIVDVNLKSFFLMARYCLPQMMEGKAGGIINTASVQGLQSSPGVSAYAASKAGLHALTAAMSGEVGEHGIRVNGIYVGSIMTSALEMVAGDPNLMGQLEGKTPLGRVGEPADIAASQVEPSSSSPSENRL